PDEMPENFECVTPEHLTGLGKKYIICDIDNTLATYDDPTPPDNVVQWCHDMTDAGITIAFVSNNDEARVSLFNKAFGYTAYADAGKPGIRKLRCAMSDCGADVKNSAFLGDQLLTDAATAKRAGLYCIIVPPIKDKTNAFFRFKRWLEKPYVKKWKKMHSK
ncbi:MAG: HAD hydrolase-like protein, partial [Lentisphaeria bacterium]|nr:HAD hydrolase-like protein [Lentisphaeria bacterium]